MNLNQKEFSKLTTLMFAASLDQRKWPNFLECLSNLTGVRSHMFGYDLESKMNVNICSSNYDPEYVKSYDEYYGPLNAWVPGFFDQPIGQITPSEAMCPLDVMEKSEFYNDWILPQEDIVAGGGAMLFKENSRMFIIGGNIRRKDTHLEQNWLDLIELITPHLQHAIAINRVIAGHKIERVSGNQGINTSEAAILIVSNVGKLLFSNTMAQQMLEGGQYIRIDLNGRLSFLAQSPNIELNQAVHALEKLDAAVSSSFELRDENNQSKYSCRTSRFDPRQHDVSPFGILASIYEPCVLLTISKEDNNQGLQPDLVRRFRITPAEADIVLQISKGMSPYEVSVQRQVSIHTVRNQLKSAMSKMGVHRQVELVNLIQKNNFPQVSN